MAEAEQAAHVADQRHGAGSNCSPRICGTKRRVRQSDLRHEAHQHIDEGKVLEKGSKKNITDTLRQFMAADNKRALVAMEELAKFREVHQTVTPKVDVVSMCNCVCGNEVLALRKEGCGAHFL